MAQLRVGELARRTGLTVRTLHHYDQLGLLRPARRSSTVSGPGYRLYGPAEVERLTRIVRGEGASIEDLTETLEMIAMYEKHFTPEQLRQLEERRAVVTDARIAEVEATAWPTLIAEVRAAMARGVDPASAVAAALAARWMGLVEEFTGGDPGIARSVGRLYKEEPAMRRKTGLDAEIMAWVRQADVARRGAS